MSMTTEIWNFSTTVIAGLPWLAIGLVAAYLGTRKQRNMLLLTQAAAALLMFIMPLGQWLILVILTRGLNASYDIIRAETTIYGFLLFLTLSAFAAAFCIERFKKRPALPGFPVQP